MRSNDRDPIVATCPSVSVETFDILTGDGRVGIKVNPHDGDPFIIPIELPWAKDLAEALLAEVFVQAPELFEGQIIDQPVELRATTPAKARFSSA